MNLATLDYRATAQLWGLGDDLDAAFRVHALVGGTPAYLGMSAGPWLRTASTGGSSGAC
ncbi:hypothetical protein ACFQZ4_28460 [Catellatospora coxensis]